MYRVLSSLLSRSNHMELERAPCGDECNDFGCEVLSLVAPSQTSKSETMRSSSGLSWRAKEHYLKLLKIR